MKQNLTASCIHCGLCTKKCAFLQKYDLDLHAFAARPDLAYHCFLCNDCRLVCPKDISGRDVALQLRRSRVNEAGGTIPEKGYGALIKEKKNYLFRNHKNGGTKSVLFPGCNFPSFYPKTTDQLVQLLAPHGIGVVYDCCGKPVSELGLEQDVQHSLSALQKRLQDAGTEEIVCLCPNCYYFLKPRIGLRVVSIYEKLQELELGRVMDEDTAYLFVPCPDKATKELKNTFLPYLPSQHQEISGIQCCGLGGCAAAKEEEISRSFREAVRLRQLPNVYTYCASCAGALRRSGVEQVQHVLVRILGSDERPETSLKSLLNRAKRKF